MEPRIVCHVLSEDLFSPPELNALSHSSKCGCCYCFCPAVASARLLVLRVGEMVTIFGTKLASSTFFTWPC